MRHDTNTPLATVSGWRSHGRPARLSTLSLALGLAFLTGCASLTPSPLTTSEVQSQAAIDRTAAQSESEPVRGTLSLEEAIARALKYNLDRRTRMMEEAIALNQYDLSRYDMLPKLVAAAGYNERSNYAITTAVNSRTGEPSLSDPYISSAKEHTTFDLGMTWSLLDFGLSYYTAKQNGDRVLIAAERRRKAMHLLIQDVRTTFWRAASAQKLRGEVTRSIAQAEEAMNNARQSENERLRTPLDSLRYQRQLLENLRLLEAIDQELSTAKVELAHLINVPLATELRVAEPAEAPSLGILAVPVEDLEQVAIAQNADLREQFYNKRIAADETRKAMVRMFPNLNFNVGTKYDSDKYLVNNSWQAVGAQISWNLFNLFSLPAQMRLADAGVALADQRRVATQMAVLAQVHVARQQYSNAIRQFERADSISAVDERITEHVRNRQQVESQSQLDLIANNTASILSLLRRYQALAQANAAASRLQSSLGMEPEIDSVQNLSLDDLTAKVAASLRQWNAGQLPKFETSAPPSSKPVATAAATDTQESSQSAQADVGPALEGSILDVVSGWWAALVQNDPPEQ